MGTKPCYTKATFHCFNQFLAREFPQHLLGWVPMEKGLQPLFGPSWAERYQPEKRQKIGLQCPASIQDQAWHKFVGCFSFLFVTTCVRLLKMTWRLWTQFLMGIVCWMPSSRLPLQTRRLRRGLCHCHCLCTSGFHCWSCLFLAKVTAESSMDNNSAMQVQRRQDSCLSQSGCRLGWSLS